jgi:hypothetical protein
MNRSFTFKDLDAPGLERLHVSNTSGPTAALVKRVGTSGGRSSTDAASCCSFAQASMEPIAAAE